MKTPKPSYFSISNKFVSQVFSQGSARTLLAPCGIAYRSHSGILLPIFSNSMGFKWMNQSGESKTAFFTCPMSWLEGCSHLGLFPKALTPGCWTSSTVSQSSQRFYFCQFFKAWN